MKVNKVYFDMDGVLSDLDGAVAGHFGITREELRSDWVRRNDLHLERISVVGLKNCFALITPLRRNEMRLLMLELWSNGIAVEILSALGVQRIPDYTMLETTSVTHGAKAEWLGWYYGDLFEQGVIGRFNTVPNCEIKGNFGVEGTLLIDDQEGNVDAFRARGGAAILYSTETHDDCVRQMWELCK